MHREALSSALHYRLQRLLVSGRGHHAKEVRLGAGIARIPSATLTVIRRYLCGTNPQIPSFLYYWRQAPGDHAAPLSLGAGDEGWSNAALAQSLL